MGQMHFKIVNRVASTLKKLSSPRSASGGNLQAIPYVLFDTQTLVSGTTQDLSFFQTAQADKTLGNMSTAGMLPTDEWMEIYYMCISFIVPPTSTATTSIGAWADMDAMAWSGRPTHQLTIQGKEYGALPSSFFGSEGGITGYGFNEAAAGAVSQEYANWGKSSFWVGGQIIIPPQAGFNTVMRWPAVVTNPSGANRLIRVSYLGTLHRPIN